jgi:outer membrane autotransporter protein
LGGAVFVQGGGILILAGPLSVDGNTIAGGTGAGGSNGSAFGSGIFLQGNGTITFQPGAAQSQTVADVIADQTGSGGSGANAGSWNLTKNGAGTLTLSGTNAYSGGTTINAGTLAVSTDANLGTASGGLAFGGGTLQFLAGFTTNRGVTLNTGGGVFDTNSNNATLAGAIGGSGSLTKIGSGTLTLSGASTYSGATIVNGGILQSGASNAFSQISAFAIASGSSLDLNNFNQVIGSLSGAGNVTLGSATLATGNDGTSTAFSGIISGSGGLTKIGAGTLTLSGTNTYSGGTAINGGTLSVSTDANLGTASGGLTISGSTLQFLAGFTTNRAVALNSGGGVFDTNSNNATLAGVIGGSGSLAKISGGTLTLAGANAYTGTTTVNAGTLSVTGDITSSSGVTVNSGGTLAGTGTVSSTTINTGGTLLPGLPNAVGTLSIKGTLLLASAAAYMVTINGASASLTKVTGTATPGGATVQIAGGSSVVVGTKYTILTAIGGILGTFNSAVSGVSNAALTYDANNLFLCVGCSTSGSATDSDSATASGSTTASGSATFLSLPALKSLLPIRSPTNLINVAGTIDNFVGSGGTVRTGFQTLYNLSPQQLALALAQLSGEAGNGAPRAGFQLMNSFLTLVLNPFIDTREGFDWASSPARGFAPELDDAVLAHSSVTHSPSSEWWKVPSNSAAADRRWSTWASAYGGYNRTSGDPAVIGSHDLTDRAYGSAAGLDYRVSSNTVVGFALAGGGTNWGLSEGLGGGKSDAFQAGIYGATRSGPAYLAASLAYTAYWMSTDRQTFDRNHLAASFNAQSIGGRLEGGYRIITPIGSMTPYSAVQAQNFLTPDYRETDFNGGFGLAYNANNATDMRSELGARFDKQIVLDRMAMLALRAKLAWAHDWVSDPTLAATFQALPGPSFIVNGATPAKNSALVSAGSELRLANGVSLNGKFDGEFARHSSTYAGTGRLRVNW